MNQNFLAQLPPTLSKAVSKILKGKTVYSIGIHSKPTEHNTYHTYTEALNMCKLCKMKPSNIRTHIIMGVL